MCALLHPIAFLIYILLMLGVQASAAENAAQKPNILIIVADDLGYSDLGCYGGEIRTPHLDGLAAEGLRFSQSYNSSRCCPSRASLLTGVYPHQSGIGRFATPAKGGDFPGYLGRLNQETITLAEGLKQAGYATYACGKWHVNEPGPTERGFDEFYGFVHGYGIDSWDPKSMIRLPQGKAAKTYKKGEFFATRAITDHALEFLESARKQKQPWLLYTAYQAPHFPLQAPPETIAKYVDTYQQGWDVLRAKRMERMKAMGLIDESVPLPPRDPVDVVAVAKAHGSMTKDGRNPAWEDLDEARRRDLAQRMAIFAAMVEDMDAQIGRVIASLKANGELDNTLILFLSDNGACGEWEPFGFDLKADKFIRRKGGHTMIGGNTMGAGNTLHSGEDLKAMGGPGSLFSYGSAWANFCNTPMRLYKHYSYEGGIRSPLIVHWPAQTKKPGSWSQQVVHVMDVMPTCLEIAEAKYPEKHEGKKLLPLEGISLVSAIRGDEPLERTLVFEHERNIALRMGDWKLVGKPDVVERDRLADADADWQLYDLSKDPTERKDLAAEQADRLKRMLEILRKEAKRTRVLPSPGI